MKKIFMLFGAAAAMTFMACTGGNTTQTTETDSTAVETEAEAEATEPEEEAEPAPLVGPATYTTPKMSIEVAEGWQVTKQGEKSCEIEPVETPEGSSNFGWKMAIDIWEGKVFTAESSIQTEQDVFDDSKSQPNQKLGDYTYLYTFEPYEFGDHGLLSANLPDEKGRIDVKIGGFKLEDTPALQQMLKTLKVTVE